MRPGTSRRPHRKYMSKSIVERADAYAQSHSDVRQAYIDGYNLGFQSRPARQKKELDLSFVSSPFIEVVTKWFDYKKERKSPYTQRGAESLYKKLFSMSGGDPALADEIVEQSIANNWQGLFELKNGTSTSITAAQRRPYIPRSVSDRRESVAKLANLAGTVLRQSPGPFDK